MKRALLGAVLTASLGVAACGGDSDENTSTAVCGGPFEAAIYHGPSKGVTLTGDLALKLDGAGHADGLLFKGEEQVAVRGQVEGRQISLAFDLGDGTQIEGVGVSRNDIEECNADFGGPLTGPKPGDSGDWKGNGKPGPIILNKVKGKLGPTILRKGKGRPGQPILNAPEEAEPEAPADPQAE